MSHTYTKLTYHIVFGTKDHAGFISDAIEPKLHAYIAGAINNAGGIARIVGGMPEHIHILADLPPTVALSDFLRGIKAGSSGWVHATYPEVLFAWQEGYGAFSVSASVVPKVHAYIQGQKEHHRRYDFREEFMKFLQNHGVVFEERFLWK